MTLLAAAVFRRCAPLSFREREEELEKQVILQTFLQFLDEFFRLLEVSLKRLRKYMDIFSGLDQVIEKDGSQNSNDNRGHGGDKKEYVRL